MAELRWRIVFRRNDGFTLAKGRRAVNVSHSWGHRKIPELGAILTFRTCRGEGKPTKEFTLRIVEVDRDAKRIAADNLGMQILGEEKR